MLMRKGYFSWRTLHSVSSFSLVISCSATSQESLRPDLAPRRNLLSKRLRGLVGPCALALVLGACGGSLSGHPKALGSPTAPEFTESNCLTPVPVGAEVTCGFVEVPENRSEPNGKKVKLAVGVIHSQDGRSSGDPVVFLHGGPGSGALPKGFESRLSNPVLKSRDLIIYDQRGSGFSQPSLNCPEKEAAFLSSLERSRPFEEELTTFSSAVSACYQRLKSSGVDLSQYNSVANAQDLEDIRVALGIDRWNLWGGSYGTRLALVEMRMFPKHLRSVVLDSVYPPSQQSALEAVATGEHAFSELVRTCQEDSECLTSYPDLNADLDRLISRLNDSPFSFDFEVAAGDTRTLQLDGNDAIAGLFSALYDTNIIPLLPKAIHSMAEGDFSIVPLIAKQGIPFVNNASEGAFLSAECADNSARVDPKEVAAMRADPGRSAATMLLSWNLYCDSWPVSPLPRTFGADVISDVPTLVVAGELDPITNPIGSQEVSNLLSNSVFVLVPRGGHTPITDTECTSGLLARFFDDLTEVDLSCVAQIQPSPFR